MFCFNQKTAYEMRISDWSSDVCSSDLVLIRPGVARIENGAVDARTGLRHLQIQRRLYFSLDAVEFTVECGVEQGARDRQLHALADRKSVVSGKSVSVRVDLGGRSILKKKQRKNNQISTSKNQKQ